MINPMFPESLVLKFRCDDGAVENLLVFVVLFSKLKNDFSIGALLTNEQGEIRLNAEQLEECIEETKREFPMDYAGGLIDCTRLEVAVETEDQLRRRIERLRSFYPQESKRLEEQVCKATNGNFTQWREAWDLPLESEEIEIWIPPI